MAVSVKFKVESGIQLLARLRRRPDIENFYPILFENGPKHEEVLEIYSDNNSTSCLLIDIISEAIVPACLGGVNSGVLVFNTDGNLDFELLVTILRRKLISRVANSSCEQKEYSDEELHNMVQGCLSNLHIMNIYDATQLYTSLHNLESILADNSNISLIVFHTLIAFYWSEQGFKITKMDVYLKNVLHLIQKITKEYKTITLYTRPEYFSSSKDTIEKLEECSEQPTLENINYRVQISQTSDRSYQVNVRTFNKLTKRAFNIVQNEIKWL